MIEAVPRRLRYSPLMANGGLPMADDGLMYIRGAMGDAGGAK